ncbi:hypothetical protein B0J18DRAFT_56794 [Chaetomium sp. MPI-SDFR-AT-0129]|nr:hypothetical protein B0J18DRAFT_56794 [Chaetomium sp. MPI-SDFR-AT-0129]
MYTVLSSVVIGLKTAGLCLLGLRCVSVLRSCADERVTKIHWAGLGRFRVRGGCDDGGVRGVVGWRWLAAVEWLAMGAAHRLSTIGLTRPNQTKGSDRAHGQSLPSLPWCTKIPSFNMRRSTTEPRSSIKVVRARGVGRHIGSEDALHLQLVKVYRICSGRYLLEAAAAPGMRHHRRPCRHPRGRPVCVLIIHISKGFILFGLSFQVPRFLQPRKALESLPLSPLLCCSGHLLRFVLPRGCKTPIIPFNPSSTRQPLSRAIEIPDTLPLSTGNV